VDNKNKNEINQNQIKNVQTTIAFKINDKIGGLKEVLSLFEKYELNLCSIQSKPQMFLDVDNSVKYEFECTVQGVNMFDPSVKLCIEEL